MKLSRKLIPAFAMLLVSAIMLTTASYAWFSINNKVTAQGMSVKTTAADSVLIAESTIDATAKADDTAFTTDLTQDVEGLLNPASTVNGTAFFYTDGKNVAGDGDAKANTYLAYDAADTEDFNDAYGTTGAVAYVEYVFQIKVTNASTESAKSLNITALDLKYGAASDNGQKAFRVAVFAEELATTEGAKFAAGVGTLKTILAPTDAVNYESGKAVASDSATGTVTYGTAATLASVPVNSTRYYKVVVRLWLEGEDQTCTNDTFADLTTGNFTMNVTVQLTGAGTTVITTP